MTFFRMIEETMTTATTSQEKKQQPQDSCCEVCGIDVSPDTNLKRFGKLFCSDTHLNLYVRARQRKMGILEEKDEEYNKDHYEEEPMRRKRSRWFRGC